MEEHVSERSPLHHRTLTHTPFTSTLTHLGAVWIQKLVLCPMDVGGRKVDYLERQDWDLNPELLFPQQRVRLGDSGPGGQGSGLLGCLNHQSPLSAAKD